MSDEIWLNSSENDDVLSPQVINKPINGIRSSPTNPYEVFRNDTTAVEVIVKQVKNKNVKMNPRTCNAEEENTNRHCEDIKKLKGDLFNANRNLEETRKCFKLVIFEMAKQLEAANQRELKRQTKYLLQQLEKEKLKTILESKTNLVKKLRKELFNIKRMVKVVVKGIQCYPISETVPSDLDYDEFESDIKITLPKSSILNTFDDEGITYETTMSSKA